ncbi:hypothetical protein SAY87_005512 [Trapa incisa]|uniref:Aspergillus nuclease S1 n=1 Tax=Trapa incisa TaxID=236973 RepID=A0AAN7K8Z3_9MYRT|nr:hypothetical protein SAY87_005512 [Trapa incisa]
MEHPRNSVLSLALIFTSAICLFQVSDGWGIDGHFIVCKIAQSRLGEAAADAVKQLLPDYAEGDLAELCSWADRVRFRNRWSAPLHFINTPEVCTYTYRRDCESEDGEKGTCVAGAINNYTMQLLDYGSSSKSDYNLTEALLFLSHFMGDIHQPLHVGYADDKGGNTINVRWYRRKAVLHHVWDVEIIETAEKRFYNENIEDLIDAVQKNISGVWASRIKSWESCESSKKACPDKYASEGIKAACQWAYEGVSEGTVLEDEYFLSRLPIVTLRLAQAGVRLAATLDRIFEASVE